MASVQIDVILRTHNRAAMLHDAVASFFAAVHTGVFARLLVVDNASSDSTPEVLAQLAGRYGKQVVLLHEARPGGQHALNCAIGHAEAEIVACFDDDERLEPGWLQAIAREFADPATDYLAGPVLPLSDTPLPAWLPAGFGGVLGIIENGKERARFSPQFSGMLTQGNCALRRRIFAEIGPYPSDLPTGEDRWLNQWLVAQGKQGFYCPDFAVRHIMQPERMTRAYFRQWAAREGRDRRVCEGHAGDPAVLRQPWYWRSVATDMLRWLAGMGKLWRDQRSFAAELGLRQALAYLRASIGMN